MKHFLIFLIAFLGAAMIAYFNSAILMTIGALLILLAGFFLGKRYSEARK